MYKNFCHSAVCKMAESPCPSTAEWKNKSWYINAMDDYNKKEEWMIYSHMQ